jgi:hypothetical protein
MSKLYRSLFGFLVLANIGSAGEVFVDNSIGRDGNDGLVSTTAGLDTGPVRTLARAVQIAKFGDVIVLKNTGVPYYDSMSLTGEKHSGTPLRPFTVNGNGATISGLRTVPKEGWREVAPKIWRLTLTRKGYYQLLRNGRLLPEFRPDKPGSPLEVLPAGHWVSWMGSLYFRQDGVDTPDQQYFAYAADQTGISLHSVSNVLIFNLKLQHFRFDGLHAQGLCEGVELIEVSSVENGRGGVVSSGKSDLNIYGGLIVRNGRHQILTIDRSTAIFHKAVAPEPQENITEPENDAATE